MHKNVLALVLGFVLSTSVTPAMADDDPYADEKPNEKTAQADEVAKKGDEALASGDIKLACQLYEESLDIYSQLEIEGALAECWMKLGLYGDAYARMLKLSTTLPSELAEEAIKTAEEIKEQAPCIFIQVPENLRTITNLEVELDGSRVPPEQWNQYCTPVNLGTHNISTSAPSKVWPPHPIRASIPRRRYAVTLANPVDVGRSLAPTNERSEKISPYPAIALGLIAAVTGAIVQGVCNDDKSTPGGDACLSNKIGSAALFGLAGGLLGTGIGIYVAGMPTAPPPKSPRSITTNLGLGIVGHF